jgi:hypothetical protein
MVEQAARSRDHHVGAAIKLAVLILVGDAAYQESHGQLVVLAKGFEMVGDLGGKFAGRCQDQRARHARSGAPSFKPRQHRQDEGGGLSGPSLGDAENVAAGDGGGDGFDLNWGRSFEACRFNGRQNFWA